jgi:hypothetical protein
VIRQATSAKVPIGLKNYINVNFDVTKKKAHVTYKILLSQSHGPPENECVKTLNAALLLVKNSRTKNKIVN